MAATKRLNIQTTQQTILKGKPFSADTFNDFSLSAATDFASLALQWNNSLVPCLSLTPDGSQDTLVDAFKAGLDGRTFYVDASADTTANKIRYYNVNRQRPKTLKEMLDEIFGPVIIAGTQGIKGDKGDPGTGGGGGGKSFTWNCFGAPTSPITSTSSITPQIDSVFYVDMDQFASTVDVYLSAIVKEAAAAFPGGISVWLSDSPTVFLDGTLLALIEPSAAGTAGVYVGADDAASELANPGGKLYIIITSFAGASAPESDVGAKTLNYYGLTLNVKDHG